MRPILEICAGSYDSAMAALRGGAQRIELCAALSEGGLTPSAGMMRGVVAEAKGRMLVNVLIRPRTGDFLYTEAERRIMIDDISEAARCGVNAVVVGALRADGSFDEAFMKACAETAHDLGLAITCHRAFDVCRDPREALDQLIAWGYDRLLTSGQAASAEAGIPVIRELVAQAAGRMAIMPGSGVNAGNAAAILRETGAREIHASAREPLVSQMTYRHDGVSMGAKEADEYTRLETSDRCVRAIVEAIAAE